MGFQTEFPRFHASTLPALPEGFIDVSWHNDICPSFSNADLGLLIFVDYEDAAEREFEDSERFSVCKLDADGCHIDGGSLFASNDWNEVLSFVKAQNCGPVEGARAAIIEALGGAFKR